MIDICPFVSCQLELACGVTLCLLDWLTLIIKPHWASESHINLGENWLTTSQGTGWPQSYWYLNNLCIFIATTEHCGQKSGQTNNCFDFHVISDSDRVMIVIVMSLSLSVWPLSWCPHLQTLGHKPDTNTQSVTPLWWVSQAVMLVRVSPLQMETLLGRKREKSILVLVSVLFNGQWVGQMTRVMDQIPQTHFRAYHQQYILLVFDSQPGQNKIKTFICQ